MTINNPQAFVAGLWDWAILDGCFGTTRIKPTDIDGCVERNGKCLYLETKRLGAHIPAGQRRTHRTWIRQGGVVLVIWGETNQPFCIQVFSPRHPHGKMYARADLNKLRELVAAWFKWADTDVCPVVRS